MAVKKTAADPAPSGIRVCVFDGTQLAQATMLQEPAGETWFVGITSVDPIAGIDAYENLRLVYQVASGTGAYFEHRSVNLQTLASRQTRWPSAPGEELLDARLADDAGRVALLIKETARTARVDVGWPHKITSSRSLDSAAGRLAGGRNGPTLGWSPPDSLDGVYFAAGLLDADTVFEGDFESP